ncbi:endonuclease/exonuclease/phosphatase family protein [Gelidibacter sp.]|uniref:endonuclease/exonuclease/phosphatase family protein n=1 Tax=Gelidibacter sp. TaxID=2018083 RepID=UPI002BF43056|nr:endonuclease/exonuclease/phosphatase family protein [Gelidibacter sp.]HUH27847.1 endonuclease/exonuclease/phosphatase family protein [Gelidibacter sp.]
MFRTVYCLGFYLMLTLICSCSSKNEQSLRVLQFNIWQEGTIVPGGFNAIIEEVIRTDADLIALSEVRNYDEKSLAERLVNALAERGHTYYSERSEDSGILSRYPILSQTAVYPLKNDQGSVTKAIIKINNKAIAFYSAHLDYRHCSLYLPRGYHSSTWEKLEHIVTDSLTIATDNLASRRDEAINALIKDAMNENALGRLVIFGGDLNEPSFLDWTEDTKDLYDHNGVVMRWPNTLALDKAGFIDTYREIYPNPLTHPGFTFPADTRLVPIKKLAWAPDADDRDRIDYVFYLPSDKLKLMDARVIGPKGSIVRNKRQLETSKDPIESPDGIWPTDHKNVLAVFKITN